MPTGTCSQAGTQNLAMLLYTRAGLQVVTQSTHHFEGLLPPIGFECATFQTLCIQVAGLQMHVPTEKYDVL